MVYKLQWLGAKVGAEKRSANNTGDTRITPDQKAAFAAEKAAAPALLSYAFTCLFNPHTKLTTETRIETSNHRHICGHIPPQSYRYQNKSRANPTFCFNFSNR